MSFKSSFVLGDITNSHPETAFDSFLSKPEHKRRKLTSANQDPSIQERTHNSMTCATTTIDPLVSIDDTRFQRSIILESKDAKERDLAALNKQIWSARSKISALNLQYEINSAKLSDIKMQFTNLELEIQQLKNDSEKSLSREIVSYKEKLNKKFEEKILQYSQSYQMQAQKIINSNVSEFKSIEKNLNDHIKILENSLLDCSGATLMEKQHKLKEEFKKTLELLKVDHENQLKKVESSIEDLKLKMQVVEGEIEQLNEKETHSINGRLEKLIQASDSITSEMATVESKEKELSDRLKVLNDSKQEECTRLLNLKEKVRQFEANTVKANDSIKEEEYLRRFLHNKLQELKGNIRVFCRIKPDLNNAFDHTIDSTLESNDLKELLTIVEPIDESKKKSPKAYTFSFDKIFDEGSSNGDIFEEISQLVQSSIDGFNVCIFTYGQTGSGKTFTMSNKNDGLIPRSINHLFDRLDILKSSFDKQYKIFGQFFEIYADSLRDLIEERDFPGEEFETGFPNPSNTELSDIKVIKLESIDQIDRILNITSKQRATASTMANDVSSRSHSIFKITITNEKHEAIGSLNLVDLAGSERLAHSQVTGLRLKETLAINKSLSSLGDVISSLKSKNNHIPYRNSKLTYVLRDCLGGNSKTLMFVNISCLNSHFNETLSSLRFASKVNNTTLK